MVSRRTAGQNQQFPHTKDQGQSAAFIRRQSIIALDGLGGSSRPWAIHAAPSNPAGHDDDDQPELNSPSSFPFFALVF
jgi:hypothetical protein